MLAGDFNKEMLGTDALLTSMTEAGLSHIHPVQNNPDTFFLNSSTRDYFSKIDHLLVSASIAQSCRDLRSPPATLQPAGHCMSDHLAVTHKIPASALQLLPWDERVGEAGSSVQHLCQPVCPSQLAKARAAIHEKLSASCEMKAQGIREVLESSLESLKGDHSPANIRANEHHTLTALSVLGGIQGVFDIIMEQLQSAMPILMQICDTTHAGSGPRFRHMTRTVSKETKLAEDKVHTLVLARAFILKMFKDPTMVPENYGRSLTSYMDNSPQQALLMKSYLNWTPMKNLPCTDMVNTTAQWQSWTRECYLDTRKMKDKARKGFRAANVEHDQKERVRQQDLLWRRQRAAHNNIFEGDSTESAGMQALRDSLEPSTLHTGHDAVQLAERFFRKEWAKREDKIPNKPFPWTKRPGVCDPYVLETLARANPGKGAHAFDRLRDAVRHKERLDKLPNDRAPGPDGIPNELLKQMPGSFSGAYHDFMQLMWLTATAPDVLKHSTTKLIHKMNETTDLRNYRPIGLGNTMFKLYTLAIKDILTDFATDHDIISHSQEGFQRDKNTTRQLQKLVYTIEDAKNHDNDLYIMYVDFTSAFNNVPHAELIQVMRALGFPEDALSVIGNLYTGATSSVKVGCHGRTQPIEIGRGTIQGDSLSPFLFLLFLEPLLRWLQQGNRGYSYGCLTEQENLRCNNAAEAFADDLAIPTDDIRQLDIQFAKLLAYVEWSGIPLSAAKCVVTGILHRRAMLRLNEAPCDEKYLRDLLTNRYVSGGTAIPYLSPEEPYKYLGVYVTLTLDWKHHFKALYDAIKEKCFKLVAADVNPEYALKIIETVIKPKIQYCLPLCPFTNAQLTDLDRS